ncbi:bacitracin ABC transporter ATP-binding protein [Brevibacillus panacihumi W25]|uniref:Bacitracin ABC transporter ATP-binding protein n=1 Tax=Brevibacillus panacihumi W25 TaxID=1408254 RepID=V6MCG6_9BACL|nr:ABC transporter ATP-binding protein [Brevibacillus panacihumi]EST55580.1 bacitracin ABC transporter ATP-binding protein [Brevibacillus panacihumi W25]
MNQDTVVQLRDVTKKIGLKTIIHTISLDIPRGKVFGLLGPNGAGKTTLIRMMVGLTSITGGHITIHGSNVKHEFEKAIQHVGAIVENPEMYNYMSGWKNLIHAANMLPGVNRKRMKEVVALVGLEKHIHQKVKTYSLGMKQRLGIAQALLHRPSVLILDEPTNGLDPAGIRELRDHLRRLADVEGTAVIVSSHLLSEMELMCDEIAILQEGKLVDVKSLKDMMLTDTSNVTIVLDVDQPQEAYALLMQTPWDISCAMHNQTLKVQLSKEQIPSVVYELAHAQINIYEVKMLTKSLEDTFLEMTGVH